MQLFHLLLINSWRISATPLEHAGRALEQGAFPLVNHRRMNSEPARKLGSDLLALRGLKRDLRLELKRMLFAFQHF